MLMVNQLVGFGVGASASSYTTYVLNITDAQDTSAAGLDELELLLSTVDQIPTMTGETTSGCTITSNGSVVDADSAWKVGNNAGGIGNRWTVTVTYPAVLTIVFSSPVAIDAVSMTAQNASGNHIYAPKSWTLTGNGTLLKTVSGDANWSAGEKRTVSVP